MNHGLVFVLAFCLPLPTQAQEDFSEQALILTRACLADKPELAERKTCIGGAADVCQQTTQGGTSNLGSAQCYDAEHHAWDVLLNEVYNETMKLAKFLDADIPEGAADPRQRAESLLNAQRAWIPFRDGECAFERAQWGGGSMGIPMTAICLMDLTAERVLELEQKRADLEFYLQ